MKILKQHILTVSALFCFASAFSQDYQKFKDSVSTITYDKHQVVTNRFMSNWFISAGAGIQVFFGDHDKQMDFVDRITPNYEINFGKWFTPGIGVRAGLNG